MPPELAQIESWLIEEWTAGLASAVQSMAGGRPAVSSRVLPAPPELAPSGEVWRQPLPPMAGSVWVAAPADGAQALGAYVLRALGVEDSAAAEQQSTFQEIRSQALAGLAQALTVRLNREVNPSGGSESQPAAFPPCRWVEVTLQLGDRAVMLHAGFETAMTEAIQAAEIQPASAPITPVAPPPRSPVDNSKTFALLLEVELPVAVSFGRAQIPLKDVLKLTTGSIVELNRAVSEPVEIIVNNCVIARGEVVVVEGNFGVRIQEVINRQDRLRTVQ